MGTRGISGFVIDGQVKAQYNQFDTYPDGLGHDVLTWLRAMDWRQMVDQARAIELVNEDVEATLEQQHRYAKYADLSVSTRDPKEWYVLLRNLQGGLANSLEAGVMLDAGAFPADSLFCEWGWLVNLDEGTYECYRGFQQDATKVQGRFAELKGDDTRYAPISLVATFKLDELPTDEAFLATFAGDET